MKNVQKQIIENYIKSYNAFDLEGMLMDVHDGVIFENISGGTVNLRIEGIAAFKKQAEVAIACFKKRRQEVVSWSFQKDKVIVKIDYSAIPAIDLPNGVKAGEPFKLKGRSEFTFCEKQITMIREFS